MAHFLNIGVSTSSVGALLFGNLLSNIQILPGVDSQKRKELSIFISIIKILKWIPTSGGHLLSKLRTNLRDLTFKVVGKLEVISDGLETS